MGSIKNMMRMGKHYKIERFGFLFIVLLLCMSILLTTIFVGKMKTDNTNMLYDYLYSAPTFTSSLSNTTGSVVGVYRNTAKTRCFVLWKFDDVSNISTDASRYQLLLTGMDSKGRTQISSSNPVATIYMLGNSGYFGVYLVDNGGFQSELLDLIVRMNRQMVQGETIAAPDGTMANTYNTFDQFDIVINPSGENCPVAEFLEGDGNFSILDVYETIISHPQEDAARETLRSDLEQMDLSLTRIAEYESRLIRDNIAVPDRPEEIAGDKIVATWNGQVLTKTERENYVYPDGSGKEGVIPSDELVLSLKTDYVVAGGFDFDWYNGSIKHGYLADLVGDKSVADYLRLKNDEKDSGNLAVSRVKWYYADGTEFTYNSDYDAASVAAINDDIQGLMDAWKEYYSLKTSYQRSHLLALLLLERDLTDIETSYTVNNDEANLWVAGR